MQEPEVINPELVENQTEVFDIVSQDIEAQEVSALPSLEDLFAQEKSFNPFINIAREAGFHKAFTKKQKAFYEKIGEPYTTKNSGGQQFYVHKDLRLYENRSKYTPHQGKKEIARRLAKAA